MSETTKQEPKYWRSLGDYAGDPEEHGDHGREFPEGATEPPEVPTGKDGLSRRRFLALLTASAALGTAACSSPRDRGEIVPYSKKPEEVIPGIANHYASTFQEGTTAHGVLVKAREGRPIHIEGNDRHPFAKGIASVRTQAEVLSLYDPDRLSDPVVNNNKSDWEKAADSLASDFRRSRSNSKGILLITGATISPSRKALIRRIKKIVPALEHMQWEPAANINQYKANLLSYNNGLMPRLHYDKANVILSMEADFMGGMENSSGAINLFARGRKIRKQQDKMNRLYMVEGGLSLTGSNADHRIKMKPSLSAEFLLCLAREMSTAHHRQMPAGIAADVLRTFKLDDFIDKHHLNKPLIQSLVHDLAKAGKKSLVLAGPALPVDAHIAVNLLNTMLGAEGNTVDIKYSPAPADPASLSDMEAAVSEIESGKYGTVIFWETNPVHTMPNGAKLLSALANTYSTCAFTQTMNETAAACKTIVPSNHWLESWNDFEPGLDLLSLQQPLIAPLFKTRQAEDVLLEALALAEGGSPVTYHQFIKDRWKKEVYPSDSPVSFERYWYSAVHDGLVSIHKKPNAPRSLDGPAVFKAIDRTGRLTGEKQGFELLLTADPRIFDGRYANSGWLQELPHPISKSVWGNFVSISMEDAEELGLIVDKKQVDKNDGLIVRVSAGDQSINIPMIVQPGQAKGVAAIHLGYGRHTGSVANGIGVNAYSLADVKEGFMRTGVEIRSQGNMGRVVRTQEHYQMYGRDIVRSYSMFDYKNGMAFGPTAVGIANPVDTHGQAYKKDAHAEEGHEGGNGGHHELDIEETDLYPKIEFKEHHWGMSIDLNSCVGCGGCTIACQSENNIPVVGEEQVHKNREMHWIRIDRYYEGDPDDPQVMHQPMLCMHCDKAPCENVCPVNATMHSHEGLNVMSYNRCVGTRYCANNCPYKVRRFNFFDFNIERVKEPMELAFNPEVTVRPRGVMEKCTFCIQRIHDGKQRAKAEGRKVKDGDIIPACAAACPTEAITFGDLNDHKSEVYELMNNERGYKVLEELGIRPSITYLANLRNTAEEDHL